MSIQKINDYSNANLAGDLFQFLEKRIENDGSGNPLYVGFTRTQNQSTAAEEWYIIKMSYDGGGFVDRVQLPDDGPQFKYAWDDRATLFS